MGLAVIVGAFATIVSADVNKGQRAYMKSCKACHGTGTQGAVMKTQSQWKALFDDDGQAIIEVHDAITDKNTAEQAARFFHSEKFDRYGPYLKDFLYEYGSDSGNVPSC